MSVLWSLPRLRQPQLHPQSISLGLDQLLHGLRLLGFLLGTIRTITIDPPGIFVLELRSPAVASQRVGVGDKACFVFTAFDVGSVFSPAAAGAFVVM